MLHQLRPEETVGTHYEWTIFFRHQGDATAAESASDAFSTARNFRTRFDNSFLSLSSPSPDAHEILSRSTERYRRLNFARLGAASGRSILFATTNRGFCSIFRSYS